MTFSITTKLEWKCYEKYTKYIKMYVISWLKQNNKNSIEKKQWFIQNIFELWSLYTPIS